MSDSLWSIWTVAHQAPLSMGFSRQEYWSGLPFPPPGDLPDPEIEPTSPASPALAWGFFTTETLGKPRSRNSELYSEFVVCWTDWFQIGKGVCQGCILSSCLFNLYVEYVMQNASLDEAQAGIKIVRRNINNHRYADDTTLMAES